MSDTATTPRAEDTAEGVAPRGSFPSAASLTSKKLKRQKTNFSKGRGGGTLLVYYIIHANKRAQRSKKHEKNKTPLMWGKAAITPLYFSHEKVSTPLNF